MKSNETIVNGNTTDDEIIELPELMAVDLDDSKNNYLKPYLDGDHDDRRLNYLIDNDWVIYEYEKQPIMIRNGVKIIKWIWRNFSIIHPSGFFGTPYDLHNYIRFKHRRCVRFGEVPGAHCDTLYNGHYQAFINYAFLDGEIWVAARYIRNRCGISFRQIPYFTQCFSSIQNVWVVKNNDIKLIDFASVFYWLYLRDEHDKWVADWGIDRIKEIREVYYDKQ
jgi:hypothetical protein